MDINQMNAGPELKELIAEKVMGWKPVMWRGCRVWERPGFVLGKELPRTTAELPDWPSDIAAAWGVVEKMRQRSKAIRDTFYADLMRQWQTWEIEELPNLTDDDVVTSVGQWFLFHADAPLAICRAALRAAGHKPQEVCK